MLPTRAFTRVVVLAAALLSAASPNTRTLGAQSRALHWRTLAVDARLDSAGRLKVRERQEMVFTGDWNGGERRFDIRPGQRLQLERVLRVDAASGAERELREGDLSDIDEYAWADNSTLRWRSRLPSDPPFDATPLTYVLEYSLGNILVPRGEEYVLDHDFAFADRAGDIESFALALSIAGVWRPASPVAASYNARQLPPGEGFVVRVPLRFAGEGRPSDVLFGASPTVGYSLAAALVAVVLLLGVRLVRHERTLGRFAPLVPVSAIDDAWLQEHVLSRLPEVVGAAWDGRTAAPEVTAVLARLVKENKLRSRVESSGKGIFRRDVLHLTLLVDRAKLRGYERELVDALFVGNKTTTDTDRVREHYARTGFDPASKIRKSLDTLVAQLDTRHASDEADDTPAGGTRRRAVTRAAPRVRGHFIPTALLIAATIVLLVGAARTRPADFPGTALVALLAFVAYLVALSQAALWRHRVRGLPLHALRFALPMTAVSALVVFVMLDGRYRIGALALAGLTTWTLALWSSILNQARSRETAQRVAVRKALASARAYFRSELRRPEPRLRDEWFPYLLAFGLGRHMDRWFRAFGGAGGDLARSSGMAMGRSGSSSGSGSSWSGMGGGGGFSGGGSSGSWAAAAGGMAVGVSAPSSSGSGGGGGGGGGGGSSGGGGGGGW